MNSKIYKVEVVCFEWQQFQWLLFVQILSYIPDIYKIKRYFYSHHIMNTMETKVKLNLTQYKLLQDKTNHSENQRRNPGR